MSPQPRPAALDASALVRGYAAGDLSPVDVLDDVVAVIKAREPELNAFSHLDLDAARQAAIASGRRWAAGEPVGPLDGVPATVKENLARAGVPVTLGNAGVNPVVPVRSSPVVERLEESGVVVLGSTTMPDWGMLSSGVSSRHGITRSPWDSTLTTGGSSAGAGAAAASGFGPLHVGTDIGGSIRLPGTWLGLTTLKPTAGRVPIDTPYLGRVAGPMTRSAADAALLLSVLCRPDARDWTSLPHLTLPERLEPLTTLTGLTLGLHLDAGAGTPVDPEVAAAVERAAELAAAAGASLVEVEPFLTDQLLDGIDHFWRVRALVELETLALDARERVLPYIRRWAEAAAGADGRDVMRDYAGIMALQQVTVAVTQQLDAVLSPVAPMAAFSAEWPMPAGHHDQGMAHIGFTVPYNMSGQPAATVNCGHTADGRTIGLQIAGRRFDDVGVLRLADWYERMRPDDATPVWPIPAG